MKARASLVTVTALVPSGGPLADAVDFYTRHLGYCVTWAGGTMAGIERDGVSFNLVENSERAWGDNCSFSIGVRGLEALYAEYRDVPARVGALELKAWGRREFHMVLGSGVCLQYYELDATP